MAGTIGDTSNNKFDSITSTTYSSNAVDSVQPLTFIQWLPYNKQQYITPEAALKQYQAYVNKWYYVKNNVISTYTETARDLYTNLINEIVINYTSLDERRYLKNLDYNNPRDMALAVPFFAKKIKDICLYYSTLRDDVQTAALQHNLKGSNTGIENILYNFISRSLDITEVSNLVANLSTTPTDIRNNILIDVEDIYDTYADYFDNSPTLPASAYNVNSGLRKDYFTANQVNIDPYFILDIDQSIVNAILKYPFYLIELGSDITINKSVDPTQLDLLKDSDYITGVNTGNIADLNLQYSGSEQSKYIGADFYYVATDSTLTSFTSGQLFAANSEFANVLNKRYPTIAAVPSQEFLKTGKEIGLFFKPDKIGLLHFTNFKFTAKVDLTRLAPNTVYYFPDPSKYGNVSGNTKQQFVTPFTFFEENYFNKVDFSNQYRMGDVDTHPLYQLYRAYQSREQSLDYSNSGLSRYVDSQDFFTGIDNTTWANLDVFPITPTGEFPIDARTQELLTLNKTLVKYKGDIYGNEYGLYKSGYPIKAPSTTPYPQYPTDIILDGWLLNDPVSGYYYNYSVPNAANGYSGVSALNTGTFTSFSNPLTIQSYGFKVEAFTPSYVRTTFTCLIKDGQTFVSNNGSSLPDYERSDSLNYNPLDSRLYYSELTDAGVSRLAPDYRARGNRSNPTNYPADFTFTPPASAVTLYDGNGFLVDYYNIDGDIMRQVEPCADILSFSEVYSEPSAFFDINLPGTATTLDFSLTAAQTSEQLYNTRHVTYGDLYFRSADNTVILPVSSALSATFTKYVSSIQQEAYNNIIDFDVYYDVLQIETINYLIFEKLNFDFDANLLTGGSVTYNSITRGTDGISIYPQFEKFSTVWFNEKEKQLITCKTTLFNQNSATNYKIIYPQIYAINLTDLQIRPIQIFPSTHVADLTTDALKDFSLSGTGIELDIVEIEKPLLNYSPDTGIYVLSYLCKDTAACFYLTEVRFKYVNNIFSLISVKLFKPTADILHQNFGNPTTLSAFNTYPILGDIAGYINNTDNTFVYSYSASGFYLSTESDSLLIQEDGYNILI